MQAALYNQEPVELPAGGIATFLTAETGSWADDDDFPTTGIGAVRDVADKLAEFGRYEDTYMVHAAEGETVVPMEVFNQNPRLKESLFAQMREMGIDPEEYIVGSELNSLNPVTGQPEFFLKKFWTKLKKAAKKAFKVVIPIIVQAVLTPILGPMGASAATSFLNAKYYGASTKDAFKSAGIAALTTGILKGAQGFAKAGKGATFGERMAGFKQGVGASITGSQNLALGNQKPNKLAEMLGAKDTSVPAPVGVSESVVGPAADVSATIPGEGPVTPVGEQASGATTYAGSAAPDLSGGAPTPVDPASIKAGSDLAQIKETMGAQTLFETPNVRVPPANVPGVPSMNSATATLEQLQATAQTPSLGERFTNVVTDQGEGRFSEMLGDVKELVFPSKASDFDVMRVQLAEMPNVDASQIANLGDAAVAATHGEVFGSNANRMLASGIKNSGTGMVDRYALPAALGYAALSASSPEVEEGGVPDFFDSRSAMDVFRSNPSQYGYGYGTYGPYKPPGMADGGQAFPRRDGAIAGPGTGTSDDIPAMLSDGEFVMTAQAVRGAGGGSRQNGMRRMYDMMRNFEGAA